MRAAIAGISLAILSSTWPRATCSSIPRQALRNIASYADKHARRNKTLRSPSLVGNDRYGFTHGVLS
jgi:hypothetical protein